MLKPEDIKRCKMKDWKEDSRKLKEHYLQMKMISKQERHISKRRRRSRRKLWRKKSTTGLTMTHHTLSI